MSVFGFSTEPSGGADFTPILKYDARAGRFFRVDRVDNGNGFENDPVDITATFKAVMDFENVEVGWAMFTPNAAPSFSLVPMGSILPPRPTPNHKNAIRMLLKLHKSCGGDRPIREFALQAKSSLSGIEKLYEEYARDRGKYPGKLPSVVLVKTTPVSSGSGANKSTNYAPTFKIEGWVKRPEDLIHIPVPQASTNGSGAAPGAPSTGAQAVPPPKASAKVEESVSDDDYG